MSNEIEWHRRECEAREWLRLGYATPERIADLKQRITARRGEAAAEHLIDEMRRQWQKRDNWMGSNNGR